MRIAIREQLALLVLTAVLVALTVVAVPTWLYVNDHIAGNLRDGLSLTASLKASRITSQLELIQTSCYTISSRLLIQDALQTFYTTGKANWEGAQIDITSALSVGKTSGLLQARIFSRNSTGPDTGLLNVTAANLNEIELPYTAPNGSKVMLSDSDYGYPPMLYPNITYKDLDHDNKIRPDTRAFAAEAFPGVRISADGGLLLGPLILNQTAALLSVSVPIRDNTDQFILGYMTVLAMASSVIEVRDSREGLDKSGMVLILGSTNPWNRFNDNLPASNSTYKPNKDKFGDVDVHFILPPALENDKHGRHSQHQFSKGTSNNAFPVKEYPAALDAFTEQIHNVNNASAKLHTTNEQGVGVSAGFARTQTPLANWTVIVEKSMGEAYEPIYTLRNILLGTVFGTAGLLALIVFPCAHFGVKPIRKLKAATENSINPPGYDETFSDSEYEPESPGSGRLSHRSKKGIMTTISRLIKRSHARPTTDRDATRRMFKIPGKVDEGKHIIHDELTELTRTFNDMSDELVKQYTSLDEKVADRTKELNESKKAAEAANESKTLFIANISHELKTPLNGILGITSVCMEEIDIYKIKQSLKVVYESGDLLLHLLEDLLSFSKNQIGHQIMMEPKEFRLMDVRSQIISIFDKQVREGKIDFSVDFDPALELSDDVGRYLTDVTGSRTSLAMQQTANFEEKYLWGDQHRILQVIINLVSNSLKFTPPEGKVGVQIRCLGEDESGKDDNNSRTSSLSQTQSKNSKTGRARYRGTSSSVQSTNSGLGTTNGSQRGRTALAINPMEPKPIPQLRRSEEQPMAPGSGAKAFVFEFEVQDTGPGIPEHLQDKVFEPFVQGDLGLSKKFGGTGLGLSICQQLAGLMGGSITLKSIEGTGTTFTMHIPLKFARTRAASNASVGQRPAEGNEVDSQRYSTDASAMDSSKLASDSSSNKVITQPRLVGLSQPYFSVGVPGPQGSGITIPPPLNRTDSSGSKLRVLVADDNSTNVEVVSRMLKLEDVSDVTIAKDGQEAYDLVRGAMEANEPSFDVIFMDVQMPNVDGLQSTRLIREMGYKSPIVALTAFSEESNVKDCMESGMDSFLSKPIKRPALKQVLQKFATIPEEHEHEEANTASTATTPEKGCGHEDKRAGHLGLESPGPEHEKHDSFINGHAVTPPSPPPTTDSIDGEILKAG